MASSDRGNAGYFTVRSYCRRGAHPVSDIQKGSSNVEHVIEIENGSTLPYDVLVENFDPDAPPQARSGQTVIEFSRHGSSRRTQWQADKPQLASGDTQNDYAKIYCVSAPARGNARINSPSQQIQYRLDPSVKWQTDPTATKVLSIDMNIT